jgi:ribosomal subunit interface protein
VHLDIRGLNLSLTPYLLEHVERRLRFALARFDGRVTRVAVRVSDVTGAGGGVDKRCRIAVRLRPVGEIIVEDAGADLYAAIDVAAERIGRSVRHEVERLREGARILPRLNPATCAADCAPTGGRQSG